MNDKNVLPCAEVNNCDSSDIEIHGGHHVMICIGDRVNATLIPDKVDYRQVSNISRTLVGN